MSSVSEKGQILIAERHRHVDDAATLGTAPRRMLKTEMSSDTRANLFHTLVLSLQ